MRFCQTPRRSKCSTRPDPRNNHPSEEQEATVNKIFSTSSRVSREEWAAWAVTVEPASGSKISSMKCSEAEIKEAPKE